MLLSNSQGVRDFCRALRDAPYVAVDTEFMREKTYYPQLCLLQIGHGEQVAAIDPLVAGIDLDPLWDLLDDPDLLKVFHSASQDVEVLYTVAGFVPHPLFDTQIAAMVCGFGEQPGYAALVSALLDVHIDKASQFTDWSRRPLSARQIEYALGDVLWLCPVYEKLVRRLADTGRQDWVAEEMDALTDERSFLVEPREAWRRIRLRQPTRRALGILREITAWREETAQHQDLPRNWIARDEALATLAAAPPSSKSALRTVRGLPPNFAQGSDGDRLWLAICRGVDAREADLPALPPRQPPPPPGQDSLVALLQALLRLRADDVGVAAALIANRAELEILAAHEDPDIRPLRGWRHDAFGRHALDLKHGRLGLTGDGDGVRQVDT